MPWIRNYPNKASPLGPVIKTPALTDINKARMTMPTITTIARKAFRYDLHVGTKYAGATTDSKLVQTVNEYTIHTDVFIATICPNFANG